MIKFSIIVPVYNVENYLNRCVESIIFQTYTNFELILIDDGSTDNSSKMCDEWAKKDNRVKVLHKTNGGVSTARNLGIELAKGERIVFIDSDDYIENYLLERLSLESEDYIIYSEELNVLNNELSTESNRDKSLLTHELKYKYLQIAIKKGKYEVWRACFKSDIIKNNQIKFPQIKYSEDLAFTCLYVLASNSIKILDSNLYHHEVREDSTTNKIDIGVLLNETNYACNYVLNQLKRLNIESDKFYLLYYEMIRKAINYGWYYHYKDIKRRFKDIEIKEYRKSYIENIKIYFKFNKKRYVKIEQLKVEKQKDFLMIYAYNQNKFKFNIKFCFLNLWVIILRALRKFKIKK